MVLEFMELKYHGKILKIFYGTRVNSSTIKNFQNFVKVYFFKELEFLEFEFHDKLEF